MKKGTFHRVFGALLGAAALTAGTFAGTAEAGQASRAGAVPVTMEAYQAKILVLSRQLWNHRADIHRADTGAPVSGLRVVFTTPGSEEILCEDFTDVNGTASCDSNLPSDLEVANIAVNGYEAHFHGDGIHAPVSADGSYGVGAGDP
ncbi:hypothetical protein [Streptomyces poonensis]|uniref:Uncharacterized protein n=1 Tax=Streptomyces poonensis TaxID=68255 RepID=A0A918Q3R9_9ACTN|nr:hypothetical protein [Streptomyces poonensis]GGZ32606.1 hypothetical protein GCM10010365_61800 [Streptomyces poonensis]GLJ92849.1 hypothetical protein GCM10017589_54590 [Streptomyces poonensis]